MSCSRSSPENVLSRTTPYDITLIETTDQLLYSVTFFHRPSSIALCHSLQSTVYLRKYFRLPASMLRSHQQNSVLGGIFLSAKQLLAGFFGMNYKQLKDRLIWSWFLYKLLANVLKSFSKWSFILSSSGVQAKKNFFKNV